jgi:hypothetical protein
MIALQSVARGGVTPTASVECVQSASGGTVALGLEHRAMYAAELILLPLQRLQQHHDEIAHRDILNFDLYTRLKHMVLHFYKYAGKVEAARVEGNVDALRHTLLDTFIICMASANALNLSLGKTILAQSESDNIDALAHALAKEVRAVDLYAETIRQLVVIGGKMAKAIESADHMEDGNPRAEMSALVPQLAAAVLGVLGHLRGGFESDIRSRLTAVEQRSVLLRPVTGRAK